MKNLIIFDCDGTLVDSEHLYNSITAELLNELGYSEYTTEMCLDLFAGQSWTTIRKTLEERHDEPLPDDLIPRYIRIAEEKMHHDFGPTPHAEDTLEKLNGNHKLCVASNGERGNVIKSLTVTNLIRFFEEDRIFTKIQVPAPKPAPDLFLFTCDQMQHDPAHSLIIEDSVPGVRGAKAANIKVLGYVGASHAPEKQAAKLKEAGADHIIDTLIHIENYL
jgi:HAD superfamily hydrolase (TIGR01509 family)